MQAMALHLASSRIDLPPLLCSDVSAFVCLQDFALRMQQISSQCSTSIVCVFIYHTSLFYSNTKLLVFVLINQKRTRPFITTPAPPHSNNNTAVYRALHTTGRISSWQSVLLTLLRYNNSEWSIAVSSGSGLRRAASYAVCILWRVAACGVWCWWSALLQQ